MIYKYKTLTSTNNEAIALANKGVPNFSVVICEQQTAGRGQATNFWESEAGKNLTFSIILNSPVYHNYEDLFILSKCISLAVYDTLEDILKGVSIKWPNDIYVKDKKIAGILIEHSFIGNKLDYSIVGVGLNLNQEKFLSDAPNPTSVINEVGGIKNKEDVLNTILNHFKRYYDHLNSKQTKIIEDKYLKHLYRNDGYYSYRLLDGGIIKAKIVKANNKGELILLDTNNLERSFSFKEIAFVI